MGRCCLDARRAACAAESASSVLDVEASKRVDPPATPISVLILCQWIADRLSNMAIARVGARRSVCSFTRRIAARASAK
jgi:hypothetical protein